MNQIYKFYLSSFLKNQTYFTPIMIIFLQFHNLSYSEIFWIYTIAAVANVLLEIPTGVFGDIIGRKKTMILSRLFTLVAFLIFGFAGNFWEFVVAQLFISLGDSFKSGTDVAYIFDYLKQKAPSVNYTEVKGKQKFWARVGEAVATGVGGFIAKFFGFNAVFLFAAVPALLHVFLMFRFEDIKEKKRKGKLLSQSIVHIKESFGEICCNKYLIRLILNITIFITIVRASSKFLQPYMNDATIPIEWFGIIYSAFFVLTAIAVRYSFIFEKKYSKPAIINAITLIAIVPLLLVGFKFVSLLGVLLFFMLVMGENIRSPVDNHEFHEHVSSERRATLGSILMMARNIGLALFLPLFGYLADVITFYNVMLIMAGLMLCNWLFFKVQEQKI